MHTQISLGNVIIVESPSTAARLSSLLSRLNSGYIVTSTKGHLFDYVATASGSYALKPINKHISDSIKTLDGQNLIIATDMDKQGELIAKHIRMITPNSSHTRCHFNDLSLAGVHRALNGLKKGEFEFRNQLADEATMIKLINMRMMSHRAAGFYTTTTNIELVKQWLKHGTFETAQNRTFAINSGYFHCAMPDGQRLASVVRASPVVTKDIILQRTLTNKSLNTMVMLQDSYLIGRLSYVRTDHCFLPVTAANALQEFTLCGNEIEHSYMLTYNKNIPHYAIQNLAHPRSEAEILVALQNRSALTSKYNDVLIGTTETGAKVLLNQSKQHVLPESSPEQQISWLLAQSENSSSSNLESSAIKYGKHFFNGGKRNDKLIGITQEIAMREYPMLWEKGLNQLVQEAVEKAPSPSFPSQRVGMPEKIREYVYDLAL
ncbi:hypothetical protein KW429_11030 [Vibrio fluvialis]|nr:hypothetical protein [Vibrio fluvialis]